MKRDEDVVPLAFDLKLMRPGCVLLQACMGGDIWAAQQFASQTWLLAPTPDLHVYQIPRAQLAAVIKKTEERYAAQGQCP
jgi:hypothetical protein